MCGILTYYNKNGLTTENVVECLQSLQRIKHRGPDGEGVVLISSKNGDAITIKTKDTPAEIQCNFDSISEVSTGDYDLVLGHRRLSIFDTSVAGHQPMKGNYNGNWIVFNGEIYNFWEIRDELKSKGYLFVTGTDTEVILCAYDEWGENCLSKFNGMWSFVIWDNEKKKLFVANDRFGVKPLYYFKDECELIFCSEQKQLLDFSGKVTSYNLTSIENFLDYGYLDYDTNTMYNNVTRFKPSCFSYINLVDNSIQEILFYKLKISKSKLGFEEACERFNELLDDAVRLRSRSDVPVSFALSGGLDSSAIVYSAHKQNKEKELNSFSVIFPNQVEDESFFMKIIEKDLRLSTNYIEPLETINFQDFEKLIYHQDAPIPSSAYYSSWSLYQAMHKEKMKVLLVGQGADEVFAGYHHHFYVYARTLIQQGKVITYLREVKSYASLKGMKVNNLHKLILNSFKLIWKLKLGLSKMDFDLARRWNSATSLIEILQIDFSETMLPSYLKEDDRNSMAFGIETRHPFMDYRLVEFGLSLPDEFKILEGWQKFIMRKSLVNLPDAIKYRKDKKGFTTPQKSIEEIFKRDFEAYSSNLKLLNLNKTYPDSFQKKTLSVWLGNTKF